MTDTHPTQHKIRSRHYSWPEVVSMVLEHRSELVKANIIAILGTCISVPIPLLIPLIVDEVLLDKPGPSVPLMNSLFPDSWHSPLLYIGVILLLTMLMRLASLLLGVWQMRQFTIISKDVTFRIRRSLLKRLERVSMAEYETLGSGTVASHLVTDIDAVDSFLGVATSKFLVAVLSIIGTAMVLLWMHWQLAIVILLINPIVIWITTIFGHKVKALKRRENSAYQAFQESLAETLDAIQQIRASNRERHYIQRIIGKADRIRQHSAAFTWKSDAAQRLSFTTVLFGFDFFRALSMVMVLFSGLSIGQMLAVYAYLWFMMSPLQEILAIQYSYNGAKAALERINQLIRMDLEPEYPHNQNPFQGVTTTDLRLEHISFRYGDGPLVLDNLSLNIRAGEKVALVGASGGGKTTLVQIILGLYPPESGTIYFNGVPMTEIGMDKVREHVATVLQQPALFNDSVRINLTLGRPCSDDKLWEALRIAQLEETIRELDKGLDTQVGRDGVRLSGGQRQRLAVARMVLTNPRLVILDEATSALDSTTEKHLHEALQSFLKDRTTLIIAHRLSAVKQADRALVFDDGRIIEQGSHEELINNQGLYASLYRRQEV
ncbi:ABC transporter ATP-binding protein [Sedimenticola thiotaurini]|uniref:ABC transporter ATP-binding protein n=1 Tax=Sedimenticola thiotaurini TaxID=1543721 RepID=A0A0F7JYH4_9GAMM|nr:ABC transporter ATP-binding protein [Sedimenticola thiotaurini]AKH20324.1 ABC transporter ATP-binding protein [Sedimenticola thiotaurini]